METTTWGTTMMYGCNTGLYGDNGSEHGNYYLGFRDCRLHLSSQDLFNGTYDGTAMGGDIFLGSGFTD